MKRLIQAVACLGLAFTVSANAQDYDLPIKEHVLENGLKLLVIERPDDDRVAAKIYTDMGAINEISGEYGSAHFLEHLMFKGTKTLGTSDWQREKPLYEELLKTEEQLIALMNKERNALRQRGVFHDYQHKVTTPEIEALKAKIAKLDEEINKTAVEGDTMKWYQAYGGTTLTAQTEQEFMHFDIDLPANRVEVFLRVEADRMENTIFRRFDQERMILVEQRYGDLSRNTTPFKEAMSSLTGRTSRVYVPEGYLTDFDNYTRKYEQYLYETFFVPNNTTLIFIGGVTMDEMIPMVEKYFGHMERKPEPDRYYGIEPKPQYERRLVYRNNELSPRVEFRYQIPAVGHPDRPAFDVIGEVAKNRLNEAFSAAGIKASASVGTRVIHTDMFGLPASLNFEVVGPESDQAAIEAIMRRVMGSLWVESIYDYELAFAKKVLRTTWYRDTAKPADLANMIGLFEVMDSWKTLKPYLEGREAVTSGDINRLAKQYFINENLAVGLVQSKEGE